MERRVAHARLIRFARGEGSYCGKSSQYPENNNPWLFAPEYSF